MVDDLHKLSPIDAGAAPRRSTSLLVAMTNEEAAYRIYPPLGACVRWALKLFLWLSIITITFTVAGRLLRGQPLPMDFLEITGKIILFCFGVGVVLGLLIFAICRVWSTTFRDGSMGATTLLGRMAEVPLSSITEVRSTSIQGLPVMIVKSSSSESELYIYTLGLDRDAAHLRLSSLAGPENLLTKAFGSHEV